MCLGKFAEYKILLQFFDGFWREMAREEGPDDTLKSGRPQKWVENVGWEAQPENSTMNTKVDRRRFEWETLDEDENCLDGLAPFSQKCTFQSISEKVNSISEKLIEKHIGET